MMPSRTLITLTLVWLTTLTAGCQTARPFAAVPPSDPEGIERNRGYALLYSTIESVTHVDQVLFIKNPRAEVRELLRDIVAFTEDAKRRLDAFANDDVTLGYDDHGLPHAEAKTRDLSTQTTSRTIMRSGRDTFDLDMLITQHEAMHYIMHLARALKDMDDNEDRLAFLAELATNAEDLHKRIVELMRTASRGGDDAS